MNGYIYNATKNEREVLDSEKLRLIIKTEGNKTVIDGGKIMTNSITAKSISANSIYAEHISTDAIKTGHVSAGSIVSTHIKAEAILSTHIQSDTILARHIKADQINSNHIIANTILAKHIKANEIEAKHIKAGEVILPDEKYGGVYINSTGLNMINSANHIALSAEKGLKIHNSLKGKTVFWANPTTGDIEMDVNKLTINSSDVYTKDNLNIGINNRIVYSQNGQSLNWFIGEYEVGHISLQNSERDGIKVKKFTKIKNSTSWVYYGISPSGIYKSLNMNPLEDWILTMKVYTEDIFNIKPLLCDGSGLNLNISFESLKTKKGWQILNFKGKTSGTVSPDKNNMIYISVGGLPSGIVLEHDWIMLSQGNTNIMNWSPSPDDIFNKEDINSRFILENEKIELGITSKFDNLNPGTSNLILNSLKREASKFLTPTFALTKNISVPEWNTTEAFKMVGKTTAGNTIFAVLNTGRNNPDNIGIKGATYTSSIYIKNNHTVNSIIISNNNGIEEEILPNTTTRVVLKSDFNGVLILQFLFKTKGLNSDFDVTYYKPMISKGNVDIDWAPAKEDSYTKEETDAKIKITKDEIDIGVNSKIDDIKVGATNLLTGTQNFSPSLNTWNNITAWNLDGKYLNLDIRKKTGSWWGLFQTFEAKDDTEYTFSVYIKTENVTKVNIYIGHADSSAQIEGSAKSVPINKNWERIIHKFKVIKGGLIAPRVENTTNEGIIFVAGYQLEYGNKETEWSSSPYDSYNKEETDAKIKITKDEINLGVKEEIKYSGIGSENLIYNSSMNNVHPYLLINGVKRWSFYKCTPSFVYGGWTKIKSNGENTSHLLDIGTSNTGITHIGTLTNFGWNNINEGDYITFSAEINNINSNEAYVEMFMGTGASTWERSIKSEVVTTGQKKIVSTTGKVSPGTKAILFRVTTGTTPNAEVGVRNLIATKGSIPQDWKPHPSDNLTNVYNSNLLENSDFKETTEIGTVAKNPDNYAQKWTMYNGGIDKPTENYHAYVSDWKFGYNVVVFDESNGSRNWKALHQGLNAEEIKVIQTGGDLWFSVDMYKEGDQLGNARVWGGMYYYNKAGGRGFHSGQPLLYSSIVGEWERKFASVPFNPEDIDWTKEILFYIYGYNFTDNSKLYIKNVKLEIGKFVTPYELSSKDIVKVSEFKNVQLSLEPDAITQTVTSSQTFAEWSDEAIGGKANQVDLNITNEELEKTKKEIVTTVDKVGELKTQADGIEGSVTTITKRVEGQEEYTEKTKKFFTFDDDFLTIKKSDSLFNINITNEQMSFRNGKVETAFINGQKLFITEAQILKTIIVGSHQIQTDPATKQTIFKYIG